MEMQQPDPRKWFARRRVVLFTCCVLLVGLIGWFCIRRPDSLQRQVEVIGGNYIDTNLGFPPAGVPPGGWKRVARAIFYQLLGDESHSISIALNNTEVTDDWVRRHAAEMNKRSVHSLDFRRTGITDDAVAQLAGMESLGALYLAGTSVTDQSMSAIRKIPNLKHLNLMNTSVTADGISQLSDHPSLQNMEFDGDVLTDEAVAHINAMPGIGFLGLKDFNNDQLSRLEGLKKVQALSLTAPTDEVLPFILQLNQLNYLSLVDSELSADSVETIRETFPNVDIRQHMSIEKAEELGIYQRLADQRRMKLIVYLMVSLGGGILVLFLGVLWRRRALRRRNQHLVNRL